ncbi:hypothetical protein ATE92_2545 [Ulvibacter sp. MAR_2010_11]|uniref:hypothetical protein n=1 Tax=Ulvibacter sp. MAR_2010_11 TaxID=1250229 RepID=UPI000C2BDEB0|nr:hypothetical protein [Ulvibacter sp. MAR_2010_11]PKA84357.1 hypothetical protein ATE92_2545 [Ulvibacter sp. MAR_2010_11]
MSILDVAICSIVFLLGFNLKNFFSDFSRTDKKWINRLFFFHFAIAIIFHFYVNANGGDAIKYWELPKTATFDDVWFLVANQKASSFMYFFNYFPSNVLELSFFTGNMLYALLGFMGFIYLYRIFNELFKNEAILRSIKLVGIRVFPLILFLPNLHFWSAGIGKDALLFFCVIAFMYCLLKIRKRKYLLALVLLLSISIRPHITLFLLVAFGIGYLLDGGLKAYQKILVVLIFIVGMVSIFDYVIQTIQLESLEISTIEEFTTTRVSNLSEARTGSGVDTTSYPIPLKIFTFLYRPLFFDINGLMAILASIENLILLLFTVFVIKNRPFRAFKSSNFLLKGMLIYFLLGTLSFSMILGNLGIMLRQKNMFIPAFLLFGIWAIYTHRIYKSGKI